MIIRNGTGADMDAIIALWKKNLPYLVINRKLFMNKIFMEPNFDSKGFFVAEEKGKIVGFLNAIYRKVPICAGALVEKEKGWFSGFAFDRDTPEVGDALLECGEKYLLENGKTVINTGYSTYFVQGVDENHTPEVAEHFRHRGYSEKRSVSMILNLSEYETDPGVKQKRQKLKDMGIEVISLTDEYITKLFTLENDFLRPTWLVEYKSRACDMDFDRVKIAVQGEKILGACIFKDPGSNDERFGPFGVSPSCRGLGIGGVILDEVLTEMKNRGLKNAWMQWASDDKGAAVIYERAGFKVKESYLEFEKDFSS
ncbi:MAG: GNAT family N-acetyltransferase [Clostridia bacterium]|nr:GNAT family N-acetyltransferase [Clostridia bacterium]